MDAKFANNKIGQTTPDGLKKTLIALLILSAVAGHASTLYFSIWGKPEGETLSSGEESPSFLQSLKNPQDLGSIVTESFEQYKANQADGVIDLFRQPAAPEEPKGTLREFTFQGALSGNTGAIAMINDRQIAAGAEIDGVRVVTISDNSVVLEYSGNTKKVPVGETVGIYIQD